MMKGSTGLPWLFLVASWLVICGAAPAPETSRSTYRVKPVEVSEAEEQLALLAKNEGGRVLPGSNQPPQAQVPYRAEPTPPPSPPQAPVSELRAQQTPTRAVDANPLMTGAISGAQAQSGETSGSKRQPEAKPVASAAEELNELEVGLDLTPRMVSQYLLITGDFAGFTAAMKDLLEAKLIRPGDAQRYKDAVGEEYENLLSRLAYARDMYLQEMIRGDVLPLEVRLRLASLADPGGDQTSTVARMRLQTLLQKEIKLDQLLRQLLAEYSQQDALKPAEGYNTFGNAGDVELDQLKRNYLTANAIRDDLNMATDTAGELDSSPAEEAPENKAQSGPLPVQSDSVFDIDSLLAHQQPPKIADVDVKAVPQPAAKDINKEVPAPSSNEPLPTPAAAKTEVQQKGLFDGNNRQRATRPRAGSA